MGDDLPVRLSELLAPEDMDILDKFNADHNDTHPRTLSTQRFMRFSKSTWNCRIAKKFENAGKDKPNSCF